MSCSPLVRGEPAMCGVRMTLSSKRNPKPDRRRALELLGASRDGCTEAILLAHGFKVERTRNRAYRAYGCTMKEGSTLWCTVPLLPLI